MGRLDGKVCIVTGGNSGIGMKTAEVFGGEGAKLVLTDVSDSNKDKVLAKIKKLGGEYRETRTLHLPGGDTRTLILCKKISQTPTAYPRNGGKIAKSPLK